MKKDTKLIPKGLYCYTSLKVNKEGNKFEIVGICPYYKKVKNKHTQENGYCSFLGKGDWDLNKEQKWERIKIVDGKEEVIEEKSANEIGLPMSLLWDMCKECGINNEINEEEYK